MVNRFHHDATDEKDLLSIDGSYNRKSGELRLTVSFQGNNQNSEDELRNAQWKHEVERHLGEAAVACREQVEKMCEEKGLTKRELLLINLSWFDVLYHQVCSKEFMMMMMMEDDEKQGQANTWANASRSPVVGKRRW